MCARKLRRYATIEPVTGSRKSRRYSSIGALESVPLLFETVGLGRSKPSRYDPIELLSRRLKSTRCVPLRPG